MSSMCVYILTHVEPQIILTKNDIKIQVYFQGDQAFTVMINLIDDDVSHTVIV